MPIGKIRFHIFPLKYWVTWATSKGTPRIWLPPTKFRTSDTHLSRRHPQTPDHLWLEQNTPHQDISFTFQVVHFLGVRVTLITIRVVGIDIFSRGIQFTVSGRMDWGAVDKLRSGWRPKALDTVKIADALTCPDRPSTTHDSASNPHGPKGHTQQWN